MAAHDEIADREVTEMCTIACDGYNMNGKISKQAVSSRPSALSFSSDTFDPPESEYSLVEFEILDNLGVYIEKGEWSNLEDIDLLYIIRD